MSDTTLLDRCRVNTNVETDTFVGIKSESGRISVSFPLGFHCSEDEDNLRRDILLLLNVLSKHTDRKDSEINTNEEYSFVDLPLHAYLHVINDFYSRGYYKEREVQRIVAKNGKVDWHRTVKSQRAYIQDDEAFYLDYVVRKQNVNENEIITLIHESCVYESFQKIGWLFTGFMPPKPMLELSKRKRYYASVVRSKLAKTFNDRNKQLFKSMLAIIESLGDDGAANEFRYGTKRFEYVWESMVDKAFGIKGKQDYFPKAHWIINHKTYDNSSLEPDTIMITGDAIYVLDAKYYKFGETGRPSHLPASASINKQITYGEYIAESGKFDDRNGKSPTVFNAFIMPYDSFGKAFHTENDLYYAGSAFADWKVSDGVKPYEEVVGVLLDVKSLMKTRSFSEDKVLRLASLIEERVGKNDG